MKKSKYLLLFIICLALVLTTLPFMAACAKPAPAPTPTPTPPPTPTPTPPPKPIELSFANYVPGTHPVIANAVIPWGEEVERCTEGRVKIVFYHAATLCTALETYEAVERGVADIGLSYTAYTPGRFPLADVMNLPLGSPSALVSSRIVWELYETSPEWRAEYPGVKVLWLCSCTPGVIMSTKPISSIDDLKGMKVRTPGATTSKTAEALGAIPVAMTPPEVYSSLEKGIIDAVFSPIEALLSFKLIELVTDVLTVSVYSGGGFYIIMNLDKWNSISPEDQEIIEELCDEVVGPYGKAFDDLCELAWQAGEEAGIAIYGPSPTDAAKFDELFVSLQDEWAADMEAEGLPGKKFLDEVRVLIEKYK